MNTTLTKSVLFACYLLLMISVRSHGQTLASIMGTETSLGGGLWQYDYTVNNLLKPVMYPGYNLYDIAFSYDPAVNATVRAVPFGWTFFQDVGSTETYAFNVGAPPQGSEIAPGSSLSGFSLQFDQRLQTIPFTASFVNPNDSNNDLVYNGNTQAVPQSSVPEPGAEAMLISIGSACFTLFWCKRKMMVA